MPEAELEGPTEDEMTASRPRVRRAVTVVLVSLGLVTGATVIGATAAGAAGAGSPGTATTRDSPSEVTATQSQDEEQDGTQRDCPEKEQAETSA